MHTDANHNTFTDTESDADRAAMRRWREHLVESRKTLRSVQARIEALHAEELALMRDIREYEKKTGGCGR